MCPPGVDQTTRSAPVWTLLAPKLQQRQSLFGDRPNRYQEGPAQFALDGRSWNAMAKLARPSPSAALHRLSTAAAPPPPSFKLPEPRADSTLETLPTELLAMIAGELDAVDDAVALGLCSQKLWGVMLSRLRADSARAAAPWAGTPIICTSSWLEDLPGPILDAYPRVRARYEAWRERRRQNLPLRYDMSPARGWNWSVISSTAYVDVGGERDVLAQYLESLEAHSSRSGVPTPQREFLARQLVSDVSSIATISSGCDDADCWALRNHTTREVVYFTVSLSSRSDDEGGGEGGGGCREVIRTAVHGDPGLSLDAFLILQIAWGPEPADYGPDTCRGRWAGHCFDVVAKSSFSESGEEGEWRDVTVEMVEEAKLILNPVVEDLDEEEEVSDDEEEEEEEEEHD